MSVDPRTKSYIIETGVFKHPFRKLQWNNTHKYNCKRPCRNEKDHFRIWREAYSEYIGSLYDILSRRINPDVVDLHDFEEFLFTQSSGYISRHV